MRSLHPAGPVEDEEQMMVPPDEEDMPPAPAPASPLRAPSSHRSEVSNGPAMGSLDLQGVDALELPDAGAALDDLLGSMPTPADSTQGSVLHICQTTSNYVLLMRLCCVRLCCEDLPACVQA